MTCYERFKQHLRDAKNPKARSHMRTHQEEVHPERLDYVSMFNITVKKSYPKAMYRQIGECLDISKTPSNQLMNGKDEWS